MGDIDRALTISFIMMLIGVLTALWNIFVFVMAERAKKASKESEIKASEYAERANEYYKVTARYYEKELERQDIELRRMVEQEKKKSDYDKKMNILKIIDMEGIMTTSRVAKVVEMDINETFDILLELLMHDRTIGSGGSPDKNNPDTNVWTKKKR
ncbi:conserved protein of unknown function [Petrocella atlantisensis]|uniref:Uncharacterized protein n=1 Tax=Petrocella atlantisensis TaxID=2173034 RepID=A0A3P7PQM8_9FIRM|nr:hypothetical protein [Petrocella atlantisensis]VDN46677.1 conserved protein of unknown function [Petrocella atlantisensis]